MHLTRHTDYALRVLLYAGAANQAVTISKISAAYGISKNHLRKVVHALSLHGYLTTTQGRNGGITLAISPDKVNIKEVVERLEPLILVECFDKSANNCAIDGMCGLQKVLFQAQSNFLNTLADFHLSDLIKNPKLIIFCRQIN